MKLLDSIVSSPKLNIIDESWLLDLLLSTDRGFKTLFHRLQIELLSLKGMKRICEMICDQDVTKYICDGIVRRCTNCENIERRTTRWIPPRGFESTILCEFPTIFDEFRSSRFELLYQGTIDGLGSSDLHRKCDGDNNTIPLIRTTKEFEFGDYAPIPSDSITNWKADLSQGNFVFTMLRPHTIGFRKFHLKRDQTHRAISAERDYGPIFGFGHTIRACLNSSTTNDNYTDLTGYVNDIGLDSRLVFTGDYNFTVKEMEIFQVYDINYA
jgi:hypothetical protein